MYKNYLKTKFGILTVTRDIGKLPVKQGHWWECTCACGKKVLKESSKILRAVEENSVSSCGCILQTTKHRGEDPKSASIAALYTRARCTAKALKKEWNLTKEEYYVLAFSNCYYCQVPPMRKFNIYLTKKGTYRSANTDWCDQGWVYYSGLDRVDSKKGYLSGNVVAACPTCNWGKNDLPYEDFLKWIKNLVNIWKDKIDDEIIGFESKKNSKSASD